MTSLLVVGDTHVRVWEDEINSKLRTLISEADIAIHCGDWVSLDAVEGFRYDAKSHAVVSGNSDPRELRDTVPYIEILEIEQVRTGITHPAWAGPEPSLDELLLDFPTEKFGMLDVICYGHTHVPEISSHKNITFVNGGQGYPSLFVPGTYATIEISKSGDIDAQIHEFAEAL